MIINFLYFFSAMILSLTVYADDINETVYMKKINSYNKLLTVCNFDGIGAKEFIYANEKSNYLRVWYVDPTTLELTKSQIRNLSLSQDLSSLVFVKDEDVDGDGACDLIFEKITDGGTKVRPVVVFGNKDSVPLCQTENNSMYLSPSEVVYNEGPHEFKWKRTASSPNQQMLMIINQNGTETGIDVTNTCIGPVGTTCTAGPFIVNSGITEYYIKSGFSTSPRACVSRP
ncbi:MAG: hypothetical protein KDD58_06205 [Bdellovibrionales bacterium]|nr:hypothetical protein [Bdellovibrionales bacterium]